ncbi:MAG: response regulator [Methanobacterium sp.]|jgi:CheY-like chemotaxis protein/predicted RNA-binding Zn-ribbon protein involved in translation (DUF1610 family)
MSEALKILYIEDDPSHQVILQRSLKKWRDIAFQMETVETGSWGLQRIQDEDFDLIILDYYLPDMNGAEFLDKLNAERIKVPVIILTGTDDLRVAVEAMKKGAYDYITKYLINTPKIANSIHELVRGSILPEDLDIDLARKVFELLMESSSIQIEPFLDVKLFPSSSLSSEELISTLNALNKAKFVTAEAKKTILACPRCNSKQMQYEFRCPTCSNPKIIKGEAIEHYACAYIDFLSNFQKEGELKCPKCMKNLSAIGTDYRKAGTWYMCSDNHFFGEAVLILRFKCQSCGEDFGLGDAFFDYAYEYHLDPVGKQRLSVAMLNRPVSRGE